MANNIMKQTNNNSRVEILSTVVGVVNASKDIQKAILLLDGDELLTSIFKAEVQLHKHYKKLNDAISHYYDSIDPNKAQVSKPTAATVQFGYQY